MAYGRGELVAVSYTDGVESGRCALKSAEGSKQLKLQLEHVDGAGSMAGDRQSLAHISLSIVGSNGQLFNQAQDQIEVTVSGPAVLAGFGSSLPNPTVPYTASVQNVFDGRALAIVRITGPGRVTFTAKCVELGEQVVTFTAL